MNDCFFPQPPFDPVPYPFGTGHESYSEGYSSGDLRDGFGVVYSIDAPHVLPGGSVRAVPALPYCFGFATASGGFR